MHPRPASQGPSEGGVRTLLEPKPQRMPPKCFWWPCKKSQIVQVFYWILFNIVTNCTFLQYVVFLSFSDYMPVGYQHSSQRGEDRRCQNDLHRPHCRGGGRLLAFAPRIALWICGRWPETYDVRSYKNIIQTALESELLLERLWLLFVCGTAGTHGPTTPPNQAMQWTLTPPRSTACLLIPTASSSWPLAPLIRWAHVRCCCICCRLVSAD